MSKISILDIATLNQSDSFLTELSEAELQISGGGHGCGHNCGSNNKGSKNKGSRKGSKNKRSNKGSNKGGHGKHGHSCW